EGLEVRSARAAREDDEEAVARLRDRRLRGRPHEEVALVLVLVRAQIDHRGPRVVVVLGLRGLGLLRERGEREQRGEHARSHAGLLEPRALRLSDLSRYDPRMPILPAALRAGDRVAVVSPAGPLRDQAALDDGLARMKRWGLKAELAKHALESF